MPEPGGAPFPVRPEDLAALDTLWSAGHAAYLVGGGVRDALLGLPVADWDIATDARPEHILAIFPGSTYGNRFGTVLAHGHEITTFRREHRYADHRRPDSVTFSDDVFEDLARRDLTINAIAWGRPGPEAEARLVDPADGRRDLVARLVRAVGDPDRRFEEDALRLLRAVRIAARLRFDIEPVTAAAMQAHAADIAWVSEERVGGEVRRMLGDAPGRALELLAATGLLATTLPELDQLPPGAFERTRATLETVVAAHPGRERLALAAALAAVSPGAAEACLLRLRLRAREASAVAAIVEAAAVAPDAAWSDADVRRYMATIPAELLDDVLALRLAWAESATGGDAPGAGARSDPGPSTERTATDVVRELELAARIERQRDARAPLTLADLSVDGRDLQEALGLPEGPRVGALLDRLLADVIEDPARNERSTLLRRAADALAGGGPASGAPDRRADPRDGVGSGS